jgi:succinoglycan biosynthesis transport protein ExoP
MTNQSEGERMTVLEPASLPEDPSFPNRPLFAGAGLGAGLAVGLGLAILLEFSDKSIRNEADAEAALELPILITVPWVSAPAVAGNGGFKFWQRGKKPRDPKNAVAV